MGGGTPAARAGGISPTAVKSLNLTADPRVVVHLESADNVVIVEGTAELLDGTHLSAVDAAYAAK